MYFPPAFFDVMVHLCVHIVDDIIDLGPSYLHNMMSFERMNGVIKGFVRNMSRPDGSIVQGYLTQECISFCENYLSNGDDGVPVVGLPVNKHHGRLGGKGHTNGRRELHVDHSDRRNDFDRANLVVLQHLDVVDPFMTLHKETIAKKYPFVATSSFSFPSLSLSLSTFIPGRRRRRRASAAPPTAVVYLPPAAAVDPGTPPPSSSPPPSFLFPTPILLPIFPTQF